MSKGRGQWLLCCLSSLFLRTGWFFRLLQTWLAAVDHQAAGQGLGLLCGRWWVCDSRAIVPSKPVQRAAALSQPSGSFKSDISPPCLITRLSQRAPKPLALVTFPSDVVSADKLLEQPHPPHSRVKRREKVLSGQLFLCSKLKTNVSSDKRNDLQ